MSYGWAVAMTQPNAERRAVGHLERQGFECFLPKYREVTFENGARKSKSGVLFSRYVFVFIEAAWHSILGTIGVTSLIKRGEVPATVSTSWIEEMKARVGGDGFIDLSEPVVVRKAGDSVTVTQGPFYGFKGLWQGQTSAEREVVLLNMLGRSVRVELESKQIA